MRLSLVGKVAIVTGANQGLGFEIAKQYVLAGADVMICARNQQLLNDSHLKLLELSNVNQKIIAKVVDVSRQEDVENVVTDTFRELGKCHILVNNAGIYGPKGGIESIDWDDWIRTIQINLFGSVLMCRTLIPHFKEQKYGKIIQLSGGGATNPLPNLSAYAVSKAAIVRFIETLAGEVKNFGIDVNAIAPGALNTRMLDEILEAGPDKVGLDFYKRSLLQKERGGVPFVNGVELALFLASEQSNGITGKLISAVWDNWGAWPEHIQELCDSDIYTLRRIVGNDRGMSWGDK